jgi:LPS export ABC transporter permease LptF
MFLIERYIWRAVLPYFLLAWGLLTSILFLQQSSRFAEIFLGGKVPSELLWEIGFAVLPNVIAFTSPLAILTGIVIGFGRIQGDSELVAMRAAGISTRHLVVPCLIFGILLSGLALYVNLYSVPAAAATLRKSLLKAAIYKVESPVEPGVFTTDFPNFIIYVREGNTTEGVWEKVFLYSKATDGNTRLITASRGRIDAENEKTELVLQDAVVTNLNSVIGMGVQTVAVERVAEFRIALETQRRELMKKLQAFESTPEELGLQELYRFAESSKGKESREASILFHRRLTLAIAPLIIAWLGVGLSLRFGRSGRGWAVFLALISAVGYYGLALAGEQLARVGVLSPFIGVWSATLAALILGGWWLINTRSGISHSINLNLPENFLQKFRNRTQKRFNFPFFGLLERELLFETGRWLFVAISALTFLYLIFTAFDLWKFVGNTPNGSIILAEYLLFLIPLVVWQIIPTAFLIAVLATYAIKTRAGEISAWQAAGQSVYRLFLPGLIFALTIGFISWIIQEEVLPQTNRRQDMLRNRLRSGGAVGEQNGRFWVADELRLYSFTASKDNKTQKDYRDVSIFEFDESNGTHLRNVFRGEKGNWIPEPGAIDLSGNKESISWKSTFVSILTPEILTIKLNQNINPFDETITKTMHLDSTGLRKKLETAESDSEKRLYRIALQKNMQPDLYR